MKAKESNELIDALIEGDIAEADFLRLEAEMTVDPSLRKAYLDRVALSLMLADIAQALPAKKPRILVRSDYWIPALASLAAALALMLGLTSLLRSKGGQAGLAAAPVEHQASGFGVLAGQFNAVWQDGLALADGALLPARAMRLSSGSAQIELFSGVTLIVEGAAEFEILSPMEMRVGSGKVHARVPEPAQGFRVLTAGGEVVDLGTEFAMEITPERSEVHVLDGEVEWHPESDEMRHMQKGEALRWSGLDPGEPIIADPAHFVGMKELSERISSHRRTRQSEWVAYREPLFRDSRLLAWYGMKATAQRCLLNQSRGGLARPAEAAIVAAATTGDRWGDLEGALDFNPTGSRVRVNIPGEFGSLTLMCWVKINSLDRLYNSLFLTDGHDEGEPHWQILNDGRLFFSVKRWGDSKVGPDKHIFYSPVIWNPDLSGQWTMIASTYDLENNRVIHFLNGKPISEEIIPADYRVDRVRIGAASIGNWSKPSYRQDAEFTVRNLNGSMDEFAIFSSALTATEIKEMYERGKP